MKQRHNYEVSITTIDGHEEVKQNSHDPWEFDLTAGHWPQAETFTFRVDNIEAGSIRVQKPLPEVAEPQAQSGVNVTLTENELALIISGLEILDPDDYSDEEERVALYWRLCGVSDEITRAQKKN